MHFSSPRLASLLLTALFVVAAALSLRAASDRFAELLHGDQYVIESFDLDTRTFKVNEL